MRLLSDSRTTCTYESLTNDVVPDNSRTRQALMVQVSSKQGEESPNVLGTCCTNYKGAPYDRTQHEKATAR